MYAQNNALFKDSDWENLERLMRSSKKDDPLKVGRFGIGFNSVYHMTGKYLNIRVCESETDNSQTCSSLVSPLCHSLMAGKRSLYCSVPCYHSWNDVKMPHDRRNRLLLSIHVPVSPNKCVLKQMMIGCFMLSVPSSWMGSLCQKY